jgi:pimeloyl-ACP methyl ester carboxylesterase
VLCVVGSKDHKFQALARELPGSTAVISNSGHSTQLEQPQDTATAIAQFILSNSGMNAG